MKNIIYISSIPKIIINKTVVLKVFLFLILILFCCFNLFRISWLAKRNESNFKLQCHILHNYHIQPFRYWVINVIYILRKGRDGKQLHMLSRLYCIIIFNLILRKEKTILNIAHSIFVVKIVLIIRYTYVLRNINKSHQICIKFSVLREFFFE